MTNKVTEIVAKAFEEACISLHISDDDQGMALSIGDAVAEYRHETDLSGAREVIYDQSGDAAEAIIGALAEAGYAIVPLEVTLDMQRAYFAVVDKNMQRVETDPRFGRHSSNAEAYKAMLAARPHGPSQEERK